MAKHFTILLLLFSCGNVYANTILELIRNDSFLMRGNVDIVDLDGEKFLISVGIAIIYDHHPIQIKQSILKAKVMAHSQLSSFINENEIRVVEEIVTIHKKNSFRLLNEKTNYIQVITENIEGPIAGFSNIGSWYDNGFAYWVVGFRMPF